MINAENYSPTSFFNIGIIVDTDGSIYGTNLMLSGDFVSYKKELKIGDVYNGIIRDIQSPDKQIEYLSFIQKSVEATYSKSVLRSVDYVDAIISEFVSYYEKSSPL